MGEEQGQISAILSVKVAQLCTWWALIYMLTSAPLLHWAEGGVCLIVVHERLVVVVA